MRALPSSRKLLLGGALLAAAGVLSCFESPVRETMRLGFERGNLVSLRIVTRISAPGGKNEQLDSRLREVREAAEKREDFWTRSLKDLAPAIEKYTYEYHKGDLAEIIRDATITEPESLPNFFRFLPVGAYFKSDGEERILEFVPTGADLATARQAREVREGLDLFGGAVSRYVEASEKLFEYLEKRPDRATPAFEEIFSGVIAESDRKRVDLDEDEKPIVEAVTDAMGDVTKVLVVDENDAFTLDEKSRLLFDPFPAELEIDIEGVIEEVEGFEERGENSVAARPVGIWSALKSLEGRWMSPDLAVTYVEASLSGSEHPFDLEGFIGRPRAVTGVPRPAEVLEALTEKLKPAETYRVTWRVEPETREKGADDAPKP